MKHIHVFSGAWRVLIASLFCIQMLTACAKTGTASVSIHGVNYTDQVFSYTVEDPANSDNHGGGELIDRYAAGGTMCCYDLPKKWRPGIKIKVDVTRWLPKKADENLTEVHEIHVVEVPPYVDGKVGELWVLRNADGTIGVVSSDYQPDHETWPGKVKGWPVPSLAYQRERWDLYIQLAEDEVKGAQELIDELEKSPDTRAAKDWDFEMNRNNDYKYRGNPNSLAGFSGPTDPKYRAKLRQEYFDWLESSQRKLKQLRESRP
jgi:hypothetical protein